MKKITSFAFLALAALSLASCAKEIAAVEQPSAEGTPFSIFASAPQTKTAVNAGQTGVDWVADDAMNVFHAAAGSTTYVNDGKFTLDSDTKFDGTINGTVDQTSDWYAFYPYTSQIVTPANDSKGYATVGCAYNAKQTQKGNDDMAHLAGSKIPLYGVAKNVAAGEVPNFTMEQAVSVVAVKVTNTTSTPITVNEVVFKSPVDIIGTYYINFANPGNVVYTASGATYVSKTATLSVTGAAPIDNGESAVYYIAIKPFTATSGSKLVFSVNGYEKTIDLSSNVTFTHGKIKTVNFNYDKEETNYAGQYIIMAKRTSGNIFVITDDLGSASTKRLQAKDSGISDWAYASSYIPAEGDIWELETTTGGYLLKSVAKGTYVTLADKAANLAANGTVLTVTEGTNGVYYLAATSGANNYKLQMNNTSGNNYAGFYTSSQADLHLISYAPTPTITVSSDNEVTVESAGDVITTTFNLLNPDGALSVSPSANVSWINTFDLSVPGEVSFVVDANTGVARTGTVTLTYGTSTATVTVNQKAFGAVQTTVSMSSFSAITGSVGGDSNVTYTAGKGTASTAPAVNSNQVRIYQNGGTLTVTAKTGYKLNSVIIGSAMNTTIDYSSTGASATGVALAENGKLTVSSVNASSITFTCKGTDKDHRLYLNYLEVTYESAD